MKGILCLVPLLFLAVSLPPSAREKNQLLAFHNDKRSKVHPAAANMLKMVYDSEMEDLAVKWVARCEFKHPDPLYDWEYKDVGQNIAVSGGSSLDMVALADRWHREYQNYSYDHNSCVKGQMCGHYTQMVWANSSRLGCAVRECNSMMPTWPKPIYFMVCQYSPAGNYRGMKPYKKGDSCSKCPRGYKCENRLCTPSASTKIVAGSLCLWAVSLHYVFSPLDYL